jgi:hypothetical protein
MSRQNKRGASMHTNQPLWKRISEDWWSVIIGLGLIALVAANVIKSVPW